MTKRAVMLFVPAVAAVCLVADQSLAQQAAQLDPSALRPPTPSDLKAAPKVLTFLALALLAGLTLFAALLPTKRGHQD